MFTNDGIGQLGSLSLNDGSSVGVDAGGVAANGGNDSAAEEGTTKDGADNAPPSDDGNDGNTAGIIINTNREEVNEEIEGDGLDGVSGGDLRAECNQLVESNQLAESNQLVVNDNDNGLAYFFAFAVLFLAYTIREFFSKLN